MAEIICKVFKRYENQVFTPETIFNSDYALYLYNYIYMIKSRSSVFSLSLPSAILR